MPRPEHPLGDSDDPVVMFAAGLRGLRETAGSPAYRALARRANFSATTLAAAASGRRLPTLPVALAYVEACGGDRRAWERQWRAVAARAGRNGGVEPRDDPAGHMRSPYAGPRCLEAGDADLFHGRQHLLDELMRHLARHRLAIVSGPSGAGKSSLVRAGLIPAAHRSSWHPVLLEPGTRPLADLAVRLAALARVPAGALLDDLAANPARAGLAVRQALCNPVLLVVDPVEGTYAAEVDPAERAAFLAALTAMSGAAGGGTRVVLTVRADHVPRLGEHPHVRTALHGAHVRVGAMCPAGLRDAVVKPADRVGARVEGALVSTVVAGLAGRPGALALASCALAEAWHRRRGTTVTLAGYRAAGGMDAAAAAIAEDLYRSFGDDRRRVMRRLLVRLVDIDDDGDVRVRRAPRPVAGPAEAWVLDRLVDVRLVTADRDVVEITHECVVLGWPRLRRWVDEDRPAMLAHRKLSEAATLWRDHGHDAGVLYRGARLALARRWIAAHSWQPALTPLERSFLEASSRSETAEITERRRRAGRRRWLCGALSVALTLTALTGAGSAASRPWTCRPGAVGLLATETGKLTASEDGYGGRMKGMLRARTPRHGNDPGARFRACWYGDDPDVVHLKAYGPGELFVSARPVRAGDEMVRLAATEAGPHEGLELVPAGDGAFLLWSVGRGRYLTVHRDGPPRYADRLEVGTETVADAARFRLVPLPG